MAGMAQDKDSAFEQCCCDVCGHMLFIPKPEYRFFLTKIKCLFCGTAVLLTSEMTPTSFRVS
jgi:hypothetical protein